ncbi:hypothetical protein C8J57DRAFT_170718 [Mycena rebaudengoi]|nr:hypothetical protein C8J57DRAFT_170718 [Mycena rebaudengoi]
MGGLALKLEDFAEDILCLILVCCDIYTVLSVSRVNKSLRRIAYSKQIWIYLLDELAGRGLIDLPHDRPLHNYSTAELIEEVKRVILGPKTWSCPRHAAPIIAREFRIPRIRPDDQSRLFSVQLLPGGTHLVVEYSSRLELWHVATSAVIWLPKDSRMFASLRRYSIELFDDQKSAILVTLENLRLLRFIRIDLSAGVSTEMFKMEPPSQEARFWDYPVISGNLFACEVQLRSEIPFTSNICLMVGNWCTEKTDIITYDSHTETDWPDHIFFTARSGFPTYNQWLYVFSLKDCFARWQAAPATSSRHTAPVCSFINPPFDATHTNSCYISTVTTSAPNLPAILSKGCARRYRRSSKKKPQLSPSPVLYTISISQYPKRTRSST